MINFNVFGMKPTMTDIPKPELLCPAGDQVCLRSAIEAGADAVYLGLNQLNMRAHAGNFTLAGLKKAIDLCHRNKTRAYLTLNSIVYENETRKIKRTLEKAKEAGIDAVIAWDLSVLKSCNELDIRIHLSTQASVSNYEAAAYYHDRFGVKRIVLARECSLKDIKGIARKISKSRIDLEIEAFAHGAMCVSYSGRCFMSQFLFNKSANRGECIQPCRRGYLVKDLERGYELELRNSHVMSPRDLCTLPFLDKLIKAGLHSLKIEGRSRSPEYVKTVTRVYREAIDRPEIFKDSAKGKKELNRLIGELETVYHRGFSSGFYMGKPVDEWTDSHGSKAKKKKQYLGKIVNYYSKVKAAEIKIENNRIDKGETLLIQGPTTGSVEVTVASMELDRKKIDRAEKGMSITIRSDTRLRKNDKVFTFK